MNSEAQRTVTLDEAVDAWASYFQENPDAARAAHRKLSSGGRLGQGEQLGLSVALTPRPFRCSHYGDERYCPTCLGEQLEAETQARRAGRDEDSLRDTLRHQSGVIDSQSDALGRQAAEIRRLKLREQQLLARLASRKPRLRLFGGNGGKE